MDVRTTPLVEEVRPARWLFASTSWAPVIWLVVRLWLGYEWLLPGDKVRSPAWMSGGEEGFAAGAIEQGTAGDHPQVAYGWYVAFLEFVRDTAPPLDGAGRRGW